MIHACKTEAAPDGSCSCGSQPAHIRMIIVAALLSADTTAATMDEQPKERTAAKKEADFSTQHALRDLTGSLISAVRLGSACRSRSGAPVAANDVAPHRLATCNRRDAVTLATTQAARLPDRSRAVPASHQSYAAGLHSGSWSIGDLPRAAPVGNGRVLP